MTWLTLSLALPPRTTHVRAADLDGDGRSELVLASRVPAAGQPDGLLLTTIHLDEAGRERARHRVDLGRRPVLWDADHGLWLQDGDGLVRVEPASGRRERVVERPTPLRGLGATTPRRAPLVHQGAEPVLVAWLADGVAVHRLDGSPLGEVHAPARGMLEVQVGRGGGAVSAGVRSPFVALGEVDGDGWLDVVLPHDDRVEVHRGGPDGFGPARESVLSVDMDPDPLEEERSRRRVVSVVLRDLDGDGRLDLGVHRAVMDGGFFGSTAEFTWFRGGPDGFREAGALRTDLASFDVRPVDPDGDGDLDLLAIQVDTGFANLARALLARSVEVRAALYPMEGGAYGPGRVVATLSWPLSDDRAVLWDYGTDLTGDGLPDLVTNEAGDALKLYPGTAEGLADAARWTWKVPIPRGAELALLHGVPRAGRVALLVWSPESAAATLLVPQG